MNPFERDHVRASDADRQRTADLINAAYADGRLMQPELTKRIEATWQASTLGDLDALVADLDGSWEPERISPFDNSLVTEGADAEDQRCIAVFSTTKREGDWLVPEHLSILAVMGEVVIDLRRARLSSYRVRIEIAAAFAEVNIYIPDGVTIDDQLSVILAESARKGMQPSDPEAPVLRLEGFLAMSELTVYGSGHQSWTEKLGLRKN